MKIAFVWDWEPSWEQAYTWRDGLAAAILELSKRHQVEVFTDSEVVIPHPYFEIKPVSWMDKDWPDVILHWGDMTRPHAEKHAEWGKPMAICFAGGEPLGYNVELFDHIFVESQTYQDIFEQKGYSVSRAFGTNTDLYVPIPSQKKVFDAIFPATFANWKRHYLFAAATEGLVAAAVGYMYPDSWEKQCYEVCEVKGNLVLPHMSAEALHRMYAASKTVVIPSQSDGGSQRTVLEAMAMNIPVIAMTDSEKVSEYASHGGFIVEPDPDAIYTKLMEVRDQDVDTRAYVLENWSHIKYADMLEEGLKKICRK
jgi:glycosyltransferase involved in cell wall biosynthesis